MSFRPPRIAGPPAPPLDPVAHEVLQEKAATLGRLAASFEAALARYNAAASLADADAADASGELRELLDRAGEALWHFVIQRELCGFRNTEALLREYRVPAAVRLRMGISRRSERPRKS